jgi:hypothetical protein
VRLVKDPVPLYFDANLGKLRETERIVFGERADQIMIVEDLCCQTKARPTRAKVNVNILARYEYRPE